MNKIRSTPEEKRNMKEIQEAAARAYSQWKVLDEQLAKTPFVAGQHLSMGDIPAGSLVHRFFSHTNLQLDPYHSLLP